MLTRLAASGPVLYVLAGMASAIAGLVPWLITGIRLPVQNLWSTTVFPGQMPFALLPFSQYALFLIAALIVVGSGVVVALSFAAIALQSWLDALVLPFGVASTEPNLGLLAAIRFVPALVVGLVVVWAGIRSIGRMIAVIIGLLVLWIAPAAVTAVTSAAGSRVLAAHPADMLDYGSPVFVSALGTAGDPLSLLVPAVVVMVLGLGARGAMARWRVERAPVG